MADIYFWRQFLILFTGLLLSLSVGFMLAFPAVLIPAILSPNSTDIKTTRDHASWIAAVNGIGGVLGSFVHSPIMQILGRKASHNSLNAFLLVGWIIIPLSKDITALYAARFIQGISISGAYIISIVIGEYVHPSRRGYFITLKKLTNTVGVLCCHAMSAFWTWRQIAIFAAIPSFFSIILVFFWPESPSYLALNSRFSECEASFKWLNGNSEESRRHLKSLLDAQRKHIERNRKKKKRFSDVFKTFLSKDFQKVSLMSSVLTLSLDLSGRYYLVVYVIQIMMDLLDNQTSALVFTLGSDLFVLLALSLSSVVISYVNRRTILLYSGTLSAFLMLLISTLVYLKTVITFSRNLLWLTALIIILQCFVSNIGLIPVAFTLAGEIFPLEHKGMGTFVSCFVFTSLYTISLKVTPVLMEHTGLYGTYAIYGIALGICMAFLYKTVPETKDKTLQEIEDEICVESKEVVLMERQSLMTRTSQK